MVKFTKMIITDIDNTLIGDDKELSKFLAWFELNTGNIGFGVATGRDIDSTIDVLTKNNVPIPQVLITSVGTEIYYFNNNKLVFDKRWNSFLNDEWEADKIKQVLNNFSFLTPQEHQRELKVSYNINEYSYNKIKSIHAKLKNNGIRYKLMVTEGKYLDIIPHRASKYTAVNHVCYKWNINKENVLVVGDSGNDKDMLKKMKKGVVVCNHQKEIEHLQGVFFSKENYAGAILDGLKYYNFI